MEQPTEGSISRRIDCKPMSLASESLHMVIITELIT